MTAPLSSAERLNRLRLIRSDHVGPITFRDLLAHFGSAAAALEGLPDLARRGGSRRRIRICPLARAEAEYDHLNEIGGQFLFLGEHGYPPLLAAIDDPPPVLGALGHPHILLDQTCITIVGTRNASAAGRAVAGQIARELSADQCVIVSGLALGIDTAAHRASLEGGTCAILAGGLDNIYPPQNADLYQSIRETGCILSEMPMGFAPRSQHFPRRNRIASGLSPATVVVEAPYRSGSMITARLAAEQGRSVCAVPGSPIDPRNRGSNGLLRDGAVLVESGADVLREIVSMSVQPLGETGAGLASGEDSRMPLPEIEEGMRQALLSSLGPVPMTIDELVCQTDLPVRAVQVILLELDLAGRVRREIGSRFSLDPGE